MIKYWSTLITVSGISLSAKLSSLHSNKRRVKLVRFSKQKSVYFFFLSWMQLRTNNWFQTETYFILFEEMEVPICRMTCLSAQILLHRKSPPIMMAASEIAFFSPPIWTQSSKRLHFLQTLGSCWYCFVCFPSEKLSPFFTVNICHKKYFLWDLICVLSCLCLFIYFGICLFARSLFAQVEEINVGWMKRKRVEIYLATLTSANFRCILLPSTWALFTSKMKWNYVIWHFPQGIMWKLDGKRFDNLDLSPSCFCHIFSCFSGC